MMLETMDRSNWQILLQQEFCHLGVVFFRRHNLNIGLLMINVTCKSANQTNRLINLFFFNFAFFFKGKRDIINQIIISQKYSYVYIFLETFFSPMKLPGHKASNCFSHIPTTPSSKHLASLPFFFPFSVLIPLFLSSLLHQLPAAKKVDQVVYQIRRFSFVIQFIFLFKLKNSMVLSEKNMLDLYFIIRMFE